MSRIPEFVNPGSPGMLGTIRLIANGPNPACTPFGSASAQALDCHRLMSMSASDPQEQRNARLAELEATRRQIQAYQKLLREVPTIFERKFRERMQFVQEHNREITAENQQLREQLSIALPTNATAPTTPTDRRSADTSSSTPSPESSIGAGDSTTTSTRAAGGAPDTSRPKAWSLRVNLPRRLPRPLGWSAAGIAALGLLLWSVTPWIQLRPMAQLAGFLNPKSGDDRSIEADQLQIISTGSWLEVQDASGNPLYAGILEGERRFKIGAGLRLAAGRPDLVTYRIGNRPITVLGPIEAVGWRTLKSPLQNPTAMPTLDSDSPAP
jgi:hypothetical protein